MQSMSMEIIMLINIIICCALPSIVGISGEKITYFSVERPNVAGYNRKYFSFFNMTSKRFGRGSPIYYVDILMVAAVSLDNKLKVDFYFYEFLTNQYKPSFVEMHYRWCDLIHKDMFFGHAMKQGKLDAPCPYPPGEYRMVNMTILPDAIPRGFPFTKGRIICNLTYVSGGIVESVGSGHIDMEIRQLKVNNRIKNKKL